MQALLDSIPFVVIATGALVGVSASLLGSFLVLRRTAMLADAISHAIVFGIVIVWLATRQTAGPVQILGAALAGLATVVLSEMLTATRRVREDAAIGLAFPALFAAGVLLLNLYARDVHIDTHTVLLGEIGFVWLDTLAVAGLEVPRALLWMAAVTLVDLAFVVLLYKELKLATFDPALAAALGFAPAALFYGLLTLTSMTAVAAFDAVGAVLFVAFVIVPPSAAYLLTDRLWRILVYAAGIALLCSVGGYALAVAWDVSIGGTMATLTGVALTAAFVLGPRHGLLAQGRRRTRAAGDHRARVLAVHLYHHEGRRGEARENTAPALREHLRWSDADAHEALSRATARLGWVTRDGDRLRLTDQGRAAARAIVEPWRDGRTGGAGGTGDADGTGDAGGTDDPTGPMPSR